MSIPNSRRASLPMLDHVLKKKNAKFRSLPEYYSRSIFLSTKRISISIS